MKLLVITWNYPPRRGGIEHLMSQLVGALKEKHSVVVISAHAPVPGAAEDGVYRAPWAGLIPFAFYALWRGAWVLRDRDIRVVFGGSVMVAPLVLILARLFGRKAVVQAHGLDLVFSNLLYQFVCVRRLRLCDRVIANSAYTASLAVRKDVPADLMSVIPPGINPDAFGSPPDVKASKKAWGLAEKPIILFVGRLAKRKGVKEFIERCLVKIVREMPSVCFVIVGDNPNESLTHRDDVLGEIKTLISELNLQNHVRLLGALGDDEVTALYHACDVVVLPALSIIGDVEGFGITLLEAAAAGKATVATRVGGIPDAVEDGKSGIIVEPGDDYNLSQTIISLLQDHEKSLAMGDSGRRRVKEKFSWNKVSGLYEAAFDAATRSSR